jgi:hypothetical protein
MSKEKFDTSGFVCDKVAVENAGAQKAFARGMFRPVFNAASDCVFCIGLDGTGVDRVAATVADRLGMHFLTVQDPGLLMNDITAAQGAAVAVSELCLQDADARRLLKKQGRVFYVMPDIPELVRHMPETAREDFITRVHAVEPLCFEALDFMLQPERTPGQQAACVAEALGLCGLQVAQEEEEGIVWENEEGI